MAFTYTIEYTPTLLLKQVVIAIKPMEEINMETVVESISRIRPLSNHKTIRIFLFEQLTNLTPEKFRCVLVGIEELLVAPHPSRFDQCSGHIGSETICTHIHPEAQYILQIFTHSYNIRMICRQLPLLFRIGICKAEIERRLTPIEVTHKLSISFAITFDELSCELSRRIYPVGFCPDIIVGVLVLLLFLRCHKPRMIDGRIADYIIEDDVHATLMCFFKELSCILIGAVTWCNLIIVTNVITSIMEG